ncbi:MAG: ATPase, partial [Mycobacterium sp.]|nr:ATPase [Mycobacterium sp.]
VVRMVHTLVTEKDDWDGELESFEGGWPTFFDILRIYLEKHAGQPAATVVASTHPAGDESEVWKSMTAGLGLAGADVGDSWMAREGAPPVTGVVERLEQNKKFRQVLVRVSGPAPGVAALGTCTVGGQVMANVSLYFYGPSSSQVAAAQQPAWESWVSALATGGTLE